jgi:hypothetical protein
MPNTAFQYTNSKGKTYSLCANRTKREGKPDIVLYFFTAKEPGEKAVAALPDHLIVKEQPSGLLTLTKKAA